MSIAQITDHADRAVARIVGKLRNKPRFEALVRALVSPFQSIEDALWALFESDVDRATGDELDVLGRIVGELRNGETDDELYRRRVRARIMANRSNGTVEDIIRVVRLILADDAVRVYVRQVFPAGLIVELEDVIVEDDVADIVAAFVTGRARGAAAAGIGTRTVHSTSDPDETFRLGITAMSGAIAAGASTILTDGIIRPGAFPPTGGTIELRGDDGGTERTEVIEYASYSYAPPPSGIGTFQLPPLASVRYDYDVRTNHYPGGGLVGALITLVEPTVQRGLDDPAHITADGSFDLVVTAGATHTITVPAGYYAPRQVAAIIERQLWPVDPLWTISVTYDAGNDNWHLDIERSAGTFTLNGFSNTTFRGELGFASAAYGPIGGNLPAPNGLNVGDGGKLARLAEAD